MKREHRRDPSNMMSSMRGPSSRLAGDGIGSPGALGTWDEETMSPFSGMSADKLRRKMKSRSHPTHFITPSCLITPSTAATTACNTAGAAGYLSPPTLTTSPIRDARLLPGLQGARHHQHNPSTPMPAAAAGGVISSDQPRSSSGRFVLRQSLQPSQQQLLVDGDSGLGMVPLAREQSEPVIRLHAPSSEYEESESPLYRPDSSRNTAMLSGGSVRVERREEAGSGQLEAIVVDR